MNSLNPNNIKKQEGPNWIIKLLVGGAITGAITILVYIAQKYVDNTTSQPSAKKDSVHINNNYEFNNSPYPIFLEKSTGHNNSTRGDRVFNSDL